MGCGAVCGDNNTIYQPNQYSLRTFLKLIPELKCVNELISQKQFNIFLRQIKQNPQLYRLKLRNKLLPNEQVDPRILRKWKIILFCHQNQNINFIKCLGYKSSKILQKYNQPILEDNKDLNSQERYFQIGAFQLKQHKDFKSIKNDIDRTSNIPKNKKKQFQNVLKRLTNQFPQLGYTQGMNFLIAYFLRVGYSQFDTFWIFSHIAINKRFLLLGLFQDSFPLVNIYQIVFKNLLKRENNKLYEHIFEYLKFPQHQWLFKWFITLFLYNFPIQMVTYAFDIMIDLGSIGIINFVYGILQQLSQLIYRENDHSNLFQQFSNLRQIDYFNQHINIKNAVEKAYKVKVRKQDFQGISQDKNIFFSHYILTKIKQESIGQQIISLQRTQLILIDQNKFKEKQYSKQNKLLDSQIILENWYKQLTLQRKKFLNPKQKLQNKVSNRIQKSSIEEHFTDLLINEKQNKLIKECIIEQIQYQNKNSIKDSDQNKNDTIPSTGYSFNKKSMNNKYINSQIDQLWDQQQSNSSNSNNKSSKVSQHSRSQQDFDPKKVTKPKYEDQLDKLAATQNINYSKIRISQHQKSSSINPKINNYQLHSQSMKNTFLRVGSNILINNNSTHNKILFDSSNSQSSKNSNYRQKKQKQNGINIQKSSSKLKNFIGTQTIRTQEKKSINDQLSQNSISLDPKNSVCVSNDSIQQQIRNDRSQIQAYSMKKFDTHRQKNLTHQDILIDSYQQGLKGISQNNSKHHDSIESQIEIFQANQVFKKKNRISSRINGGINSSTNQNMKKLKLTHNISDLDILHKNQKLSSRKNIMDMQLNYQQSCQSFFVTSRQMDQKIPNFKQQIHKYQIEIVK